MCFVSRSQAPAVSSRGSAAACKLLMLSCLGDVAKCFLTASSSDDRKEAGLGEEMVCSGLGKVGRFRGWL